ncbi:DUF4192 domain-containing protein [Nocardioides cynanchi]|uniref:DUF4192 domain-containing protein n=1 Tax=Nocardioides cynanchi TaxID=2558918 RepID=UPI001248E823|nr:DUF4192 domain-containing protein [Nocardioides cynanchi]
MTTSLTARGPEDLLAAVPVVLGFRPTDSVVMLTFGAPCTFHARVDLPPPDDPEALIDLSEALRAPCLLHDVGRVAFVLYADDADLSARIGARLRAGFAEVEIGVIDVLRVSRGRWWSVPDEPGRSPGEGLPFDDTCHWFAAQAVFDGRVTHASRDDLRATLAPDLEARARVQARLPAGPCPAVAAEEAWLVEMLRHWVGSGAEPDDEEAGRVLRAVAGVEPRDAALFLVSRETAREHLRIWSGLLRRAPEGLVPSAAVLAAFAAWQSGHGALAWCALDRCLEVRPDHRLGLGLAECLTRAVPPSAWHEVPGLSSSESDTG